MLRWQIAASHVHLARAQLEPFRASELGHWWTHLVFNFLVLLGIILGEVFQVDVFSRCSGRLLRVLPQTVVEGLLGHLLASDAICMLDELSGRVVVQVERAFNSNRE